MDMQPTDIKQLMGSSPKLSEPRQARRAWQPWQ